MRRPVLFYAPYCPWPVSHGGCMAVFHRLRALAADYDFHLVFPEPPGGAAARAEALEALRPLARSVQLYELDRPRPGGRVAELLRFVAGAFLGRAPVSTHQARGRSLAAALRAALAEGQPEFVVAEHIYSLALWPREMRARIGRAGFPPVGVVEQNVEHLVWRDAATNPNMSMLRRRASAWEARKLRQLARLWYPRLRGVMFISPADRMHFAALGWNPCLHAGNVILPPPAETKADFGASGRVVFVGTLGYWPNEEGLRWFHAEVWPRVRATRPEARLVVGGEPPPGVRAALGNDPSVELLGPRPHAEMDAIMRAGDAFVSPIRLGSGIKMKNILALSLGLPLVATSESMRGIRAEAGVHALVADGAAALAEGLTRLTASDPSLRASLGQSARALFDAQYSTPGALPPWRAFFDGRPPLD